MLVFLKEKIKSSPSVMRLESDKLLVIKDEDERILIYNAC